MLILSRKQGEKVLVGNDIVVSVVAVRGAKARIGIEAPAQIRILRSELYGRPLEQGEPPMPSNEQCQKGSGPH
jgi:carbon storage regulator